MIHLPYIFLVLFFSFLCELLFGLYGIVIPFVAVTLFYLTIIYDLRVGFSLAIICGVILDTVYGRIFYISPLTLAVITVFSVFWLKKGVVKNFHFQFIPGITVSLIYIIPIFGLTYFMYEKGFLTLFINTLFLLSEIIIGSFVLLFIVYFLDSINSKLKLNLYTKAKELDK